MTWIGIVAVLFTAIMAVSGFAELAWRKLRKRRTYVPRDWDVRLSLTLFFFGALVAVMVAIQALSHFGVLNLMVAVLPAFVALLAITRSKLATKLEAIEERDKLAAR